MNKDWRQICSYTFAITTGCFSFIPENFSQMFILGLFFLSIGAMQLTGFYSYCWLAS